MPGSNPNKKFYNQLLLIFLSSAILVSCIIPRRYQEGKPFVYKNTIEVKGGKFTRDELSTLKQRLNAQLDDSARVTTKDAFFVLHYINAPPAYDSAYAGISARNMQASMQHLGFYKSIAGYKADTLSRNGQQRMYITYTIIPGKQTRVDTLSYHLRKPGLQQLALENKDNSLLQVNKPVTRTAVVGEIGRLVNLFRNNGYYKLTADELRMRGDTTIAALTNISGDPFEQLASIAEAQAKRDSPRIKLAVVLNPPADSSKLEKYYIRHIYILPDYIPGDRLSDTTITQRAGRNYIIRYHRPLFKTKFLVRNAFLRKGNLYRQDDYYKTLNSFTKTGVWQSINVQLNEVRDSNKIDAIIQLIPGKKLGFEASLESSYSASSTNTSTNIAGTLIGFSGKLSLLNRNFAREGIRMTHTLSAGIELNKNRTGPGNNNNLINSNEASYSNSTIFPKFIFPLSKFNSKKLILAESFINSSVSYINRIDLFDLQSVKLGMGFNWSGRSNRQWSWKPINAEFSYLYNQTDIFRRTIDSIPFLRYSFNSAFVADIGIPFLGYSSTHVNPKNARKQHTFKWNYEESGYILGLLTDFNNYLRKFVKTDITYTYSRSYPKSAIVTRLFGGVGVASKKDTTLPFFKQYFGGGSNSMRGWPIRGIGRGSQPLVPYDPNGKVVFNDRTGDMQLEGNFEYRYDIAQLIPNSLVLKGALFVDAGNIWNLRNTNPAGGRDSAQFQFRNLYKELGVAAGTGFRLDFYYFILRFDLGFRFKRPESSYINNGWKAPPLGFDDVLPKLFARKYREWRYENFNFTIGINYSF